MSFFTSLFSCCFSDSENEKSDAEARRARIETIYAGSVLTAESMIAAPPPCYADIARDRPFVVADEKRTPIVEQPPPLQQPQYPHEPRRFSVSSGSSVVSVPSTRLSDLTSLRTGTTRRQQNGDRDDRSETNETWSDSGYYGSNDSAPPSYYAGSERSVTPAPVPQPPFGVQHPVMQEGWLESLRFDAERERAVHRPGDYRNAHGATYYNAHGRPL